jgi:hypothetical protein
MLGDPLGGQLRRRLLGPVRRRRAQEADGAHQVDPAVKGERGLAPGRPDGAAERFPVGDGQLQDERAGHRSRACRWWPITVLRSVPSWLTGAVRVIGCHRRPPRRMPAGAVAPRRSNCQDLWIKIIRQLRAGPPVRAALPLR